MIFICEKTQKKRNKKISANLLQTLESQTGTMKKHDPRSQTVPSF